jgi:hypothetical protein
MSQIYKQVNAGSGVVDSITGTAPILANGVSGVPQVGNVTISSSLATTTTTGVASFNPANFTVSGTGEVSAIGGGGTLTSVTTSNATPQFVLTGTVENVNFGISNLLLGSSGSAITAALENVGYGEGALNALTSGDSNVAVGFQALLVNTIGASNVAIGNSAMNQNISSGGNVGIGQEALFRLLSGTGLNTSIGNESLTNLTTGAYNISIGQSAGNNYTSSESSNIVIGNPGKVLGGESNVIRIGTQGTGNGEQNECFMAGITGATAVGSPVAVSSTGQLSDLGFGTSTQVLTSNGPGVSPTWQAAGGGGGGSTVYFQAYMTSPQTIPASVEADLIFGTAIDNVGSGYNASTGIFTAPKTDFYQFSIVAYFNSMNLLAANTEAILGYLGSVQSLRLVQINSGAYTGGDIIFNASWGMPMTAGDTIQAQVFADGSGNYDIYGSSLSSSPFNTASTFSGFSLH